MARPNPVRTPEGFNRIDVSGDPVPQIVVGGYTQYDAINDAPLSKGAKITDEVAGGTADVFIQGFGFDAAATFDLVVSGAPPIAPATIQAVAFLSAPSGTTPGVFQVTIALDATPADSRGQYALVMTNAQGNRDLVNVLVTQPPV